MFKITNSQNRSIGYKQFTFPGGEVGFQLDGPNYAFFGVGPYKIKARLHRSEDVVALAMLKDAIEQIEPDAVVNLYLPYVPYARQDRVCNWGESFSLKVFGRFINSLNFNSVRVVDPHSDVTAGVLDRIRISTQLEIIQTFGAFRNMVTDSNCVFLSPDAGANKKTSTVASYFGHREFIRADKLRDLSNGKIKETIIYCDDLKGCDVIILDDICEKGGTFIALAEQLKKKNCGKIILYVTHGIFSHEKSVNILFENGIDEVYTTDSYWDNPLGYYPEGKLFIKNL